MNAHVLNTHAHTFTRLLAHSRRSRLLLSHSHTLSHTRAYSCRLSPATHTCALKCVPSRSHLCSCMLFPHALTHTHTPTRRHYRPSVRPTLLVAPSFVSASFHRRHPTVLFHTHSRTRSHTRLHRAPTRTHSRLLCPPVYPTRPCSLLSPSPTLASLSHVHISLRRAYTLTHTCPHTTVCVRYTSVLSLLALTSHI
jgi:hypothetical protein